MEEIPRSTDLGDTKMEDLLSEKTFPATMDPDVMHHLTGEDPGVALRMDMGMPIGMAKVEVTVGMMGMAIGMAKVEVTVPTGMVTTTLLEITARGKMLSTMRVVSVEIVRVKSTRKRK